MGFEVLDGYLLGEPVSKPDVVTALLANRSTAAAAAPFYRALEAVGARAADEAFIALRLVLAGRSPDDDAVRRLRALAGIARAVRTHDRAGLASLCRREGTALADVLAGPAEDLGTRARAAYFEEVASTSHM
jgi:hypothetical protein